MVSIGSCGSVQCITADNCTRPVHCYEGPVAQSQWNSSERRRNFAPIQLAVFCGLEVQHFVKIIQFFFSGRYICKKERN